MVTIGTFRSALTELAAGVVIVTTAMERDRRGMTATAVCSVCAEPATILACINRKTETCKMVRTTGRFAVNILNDEHQLLAETFAGRTGIRGEERFRLGAWMAGAKLGMPTLNGATAIECEVSEIVNTGTHAVVFGHVIDVQVRGIDPLLYHAGKFGRLVACPALLESHRRRLGMNG